MKEKLPPRIPLAQLPTPIEKLERITRELNGPEIYVKRDDLTDVLMTGNKVRKAEFFLAEAREQALDRMIDEAENLGANAVISLRFATSMLMTGAAELLAYGTAVVIED